MSEIQERIQILDPAVPFKELLDLLKQHFKQNQSSINSLDWNLEQNKKWLCQSAT